MNKAVVSKKVQAKRCRRAVLSRQKRHRRRGGRRCWASLGGLRSPAFVRVHAPSTLGLAHYVHRNATIAFCSRFRKAVLEDRRDLILDFTATKLIQPEGMLLVVAELDRIKRMVAGNKVLRCSLPGGSAEPTQIVRQVLYQVGVLDLTSYDTSLFDPAEFHDSVRHWQYATGTRVDEEPGNILEAYEGKIAPALMQKMQIGLSEAITNCLHHAYKAPRGDNCPFFGERRWWMFTRESDDQLTVVVCDLGIGIPNSLPLTWGKATIGKLLSNLGVKQEDLASIQLALRLGESSTGEGHRGKGLPQIWNATRASSAGHIAIHSGRGLLGYSGTRQEDVASQYRSSILGTMIVWTVPVEAAKDDG